MKLARHYIDGTWIDNGEVRNSVNPADDSTVGSFHLGSRALVDQAAGVARKVFFDTAWQASPRLRATVLYEFADRMAAAKDEIADLIVAENGKLRAEAVGETMGAISEVRYYAGLARAFQGRTQETAPGNISLLHREAAGVAGIIVPWNAPVTC